MQLHRLCLFTIILACISPVYSEAAGKKDFRKEANGNLSVRHNAHTRFEFEKTQIAPESLDRLARAISFAFDNDSAREVNSEDLYHAHFFYLLQRGEVSIGDVPDVILLHAQDYIIYSPETKLKRNIVVWHDGNVSIVPCHNVNGSIDINDERNPCSVSPWDLGITEYHEEGVFFVNVDDAPRRLLRGYEKNIRIVHGQKILFGKDKRI